MLSLMAITEVVRGEPSLIIMSLRSLGVGPFLVEGALVVGWGGAAAGADQANGGVLFFLAFELRVPYNHSERKNHTKSFAKTLSHWPKALFFSFTPLFKEKEVCLTTSIMSSHGNKGKKKNTFNPDVSPFKWSEIPDDNTGIGLLATPSTSKRPQSDTTSSLPACKPESDPLTDWKTRL
jgi:hypothetical protein